MKRDVRGTPLWAAVTEHFENALGPAFGRVSAAEDPAPAPDGSAIAFTGTIVRALRGSPEMRICLVPSSGGEVEQLTFGPHSDRSPAWSPDGSMLAFLSDRRKEGCFEVFLLEAERIGEARVAAEIDGSVEYLEWSGDGSAILLGVAGAAAEHAGVHGSGALHPGEDDAGWRPEVHGGPAPDEWRSAWIYDVAGGKARRVSLDGLNVWECSWAGPSALAAIASDSPLEGDWYDAPLVRVELESGRAITIYKSEVQLGVPAPSPSGTRVAVIEALSSDRLMVAGDLLIFEGSGSPARIDTMGVDVTSLKWRDDQRLSFIGYRNLETVIGEVDSTTGDVEVTFSTREACGGGMPQYAHLGPHAYAAVLNGYDRYPEIAVIEPAGVRPVTTLAHDGTRYLLGAGGRIEDISWQAPDGLEVFGWLVRPTNAVPPYATVMLVHGGPVGTHVNAWIMREKIAPIVERGYAVFMPNPRGGMGRGQEFINAVFGDMGGADAQDLLAGCDALVERGVADPRRFGVMGRSYGGFMTAWLVTRTDRFTAGVCESPVTDWYSQHFSSSIGRWDRLFLNDDVTNPGGEYFKRSPVVHAGRVSTPVFVSAGMQDRCTPPGQAVEFYQALQEHGVESALALYPEEGHGVRTFPALIDYNARRIEWLERHMPPR